MTTLIYFILSVIGLLVILQLGIRLSTFLKKGRVVEGITGSLGKQIASGKQVLVYFYTNSCAACKPMTPVVDRLKNEFSNIHKVNLAKDMDTGKKFGVMGTPALVLVRNRKIESFSLGAKNESSIRRILEQ